MTRASRSLAIGICALTLAFASTSHATITYDDDVTSNILFGSGVANGQFTVDRQNGIELGLRAKVRFPVPVSVYNSNHDGTYTFRAGVLNGVENPQWNFDWSVNTNYNGSGGNLSAYTFKLEMDFDPSPETNFLAWNHVSAPTQAIPYASPVNPGYYDHSIGNNATANGGGVEASDPVGYAALLAANNVAQNSWRYTFYDGAPFLFDATKTGIYDIRLTAYQGAVQKAQVTIQVIVDSIYDALPSPLPPNIVSLGYEATSTTEFGDNVTFVGTDRYVTDVTVTMSTWAPHADYPSMSASGWTHPITLNIYEVDHSGPNPAKGALLKSVTQTFDIPWRPAADPTCATPTAWRSPTDNLCYNGYAFDIVFDVDTLINESEVIYGIVYNTADYGPAPLGVPGPYNSLNVGLRDTGVFGQPLVGTDVEPDALFWNTSFVGFYTAPCPGGTFCRDIAWAPYTPAVRFEAVACDDDDGDGVCNPADNCPADVNASQADLDDDGVGDRCDSSDSELNVTRLRLKRNTSGNPAKPNGVVKASGDLIIDQPAGDGLSASGGITASVVDSLNLDTATLSPAPSWSAASCVTRTAGPVVRSIQCKSPDKRYVLAFRAVNPLSTGAQVYKFTLTLQRIDISGPFDAPVTVRLSQAASIDRAGVIEQCQSNSAGLTCKEG